jgi:DNA excision repair protein ERCC-2
VTSIRFFPYDTFRRGQKEVLKVGEELLSRSKVLVIKAPTGFGKTSVAISLSMLRPPVLHSVRTRNEITPVLRDLKLLRRKLGSLRYSFIHSAHTMCPLTKGKHVEPEDFWISCSILRDLKLCEFFRGLGRVGIEVIEAVVYPSENHVDAVKRIVDTLKVCPYFSLAKLANYSDYVVVTYPYVFNLEFFEDLFQDRNTNEYSVVVDEAHMITNPATIYSYEVSTSRVKTAINEVNHYLGGDEVLRNFLSNLVSIAESKAKDDKLRILDKDILNIDEDLINYVMSRALDIKKMIIDELIMSGKPVSSVMSRGASIVKVATLISNLAYEGFALFTYRDSNNTFLTTMATSHDVINRVLSSYKSLILMSGTPPSKEFLEKVIGMKGVEFVDALELGAWSPYENLVILLTSQLTSKYEVRGEAIYELYAKYIRVVDELVSGVKLVVYPSYEFMSNVFKYVGRGFTESRTTTIDELISYISDNTLIHAVAGGKLCEGIEIVRDGKSLINCVFVAGVPYPQSDDYLVEVMKNLKMKVSADEAWDYIYNMESSIKTLQAIGRSIRSEDDRALVVLGDRRFLSRSLRKYLGLKINKVVRDLKEFEGVVKLLVEEFL